ncbi:unnamed protein product, partial [Polarella glacialis]
TGTPAVEAAPAAAEAGDSQGPAAASAQATATVPETQTAATATATEIATETATSAAAATAPTTAAETATPTTTAETATVAAAATMATAIAAVPTAAATTTTPTTAATATTASEPEPAACGPAPTTATATTATATTAIEAEPTTTATATTTAPTTTIAACETTTHLAEPLSTISIPETVEVLAVKVAVAPPAKLSSATSEQLLVCVDRSFGAPLGIDVETGRDSVGWDGRTVLIRGIKPSGLIEAWCKGHPGEALHPGDRIVAANGVRGDALALLGECQKMQVLHLEIARAVQQAPLTLMPRPTRRPPAPEERVSTLCAAFASAPSATEAVRRLRKALDGGNGGRFW